MITLERLKDVIENEFEATPAYLHLLKNNWVRPPEIEEAYQLFIPEFEKKYDIKIIGEIISYVPGGIAYWITTGHKFNTSEAELACTLAWGGI